MSLACIDQFISPVLFHIQKTSQPFWNLFNNLASSNRQDLITEVKTTYTSDRTFDKSSLTR
jgi:hypothetical protein